MRAIIGLVWALLAVVLGWRAMTVKAPEIEADIRARTSAEVEKVLPGVETDVDGRFVTLRGVAPDEAAKAKALETADGVWGALGPYDGLSIPAAVSGVASWIGAFKSADGSLSLTGTVPSGEVRDQIVAAAKSAFSGAIDDRLDIAGNAAPDAMGSLGEALGALSRLDAGSALVTAARTVVSGVTGDKAVAEDVGAMAANQGWSVVVNGPGAPEAPGRLMAVKTPDGAIVATGEVDSEATRKSVIDALSAGASSVVDRLAIRDAGLGTDWAERAAGGARALAGLDFGSMALEGAKSFLKGVTAPDRVEPVAAELGAGWTPEITARAANPDAGRIAELEAALAKAGDAARASDARIADLEAAIARAGEESAAAKARIADLEKALSDAGAAGQRVGELEKALAEAQAAARNAAADLDAARKRIAELEAQLAAVPVQPAAPAQPATPGVSAAERCDAAIAGILNEQKINFNTGSAVLSQSAGELLDLIAVEAIPCARDEGLTAEIGGHTDNVGRAESNLALSQLRADAVRDALLARNVPAEALTARGYGMTRPVADNSTEAGRSANRRISFTWTVR